MLIQTNTNQYIPIHTTILATIWASRLESTRIVFEYMPNTYLIHTNTYQNTCQYLYAGRKPVCCTEIEYMPLHAKHMPIYTNTYHDTCQIHTNTVSVQHTGFRPAYKNWHVSWYVLACILQVFGMYYVMILVNTSKYINTYQYVHYLPAYKYWHVSWYVLVCIVQVFGMYYVMILVNTNKYINTYQYVHYLPFFQYISILVNTQPGRTLT